MKPFLKFAPTLAGLTVILTISLSACATPATPTPTADVSVFYTQAAATVVQGLTQTAVAMPTSTPTATSTTTPIPSPTPDLSLTALAGTATPVPPAQSSFPSATPIPVNPATAFGCYNASFVADVTIQFAPNYKPGDSFTKTWRVKNTGSCDWPRGFKIAYVSGDHFGTDTTEIGQKVTAGNFAEISLNMTAPNLSGVVTSNWQLTTDIGKAFGPVLQAAITLPASPTATAGTVTGSSCLNSTLVEDVTIPSGTEMNTNQTFTKTWRIKNTGTCSWSTDFKLVFVGGDTLGSDTTKIRQNIGPGANLEISLDMTAPSTTGIISSAWQLASESGQLFGELFSFSITVK